MAVRNAADFIDRYQRIFFACHARHVRDPRTGREVSARQASILSHLDGVEPTDLGTLAMHMGVTPSTMSISIDRLVRQGYVSRERDPRDGRVRHLRLTENGERVRDAQRVLEPALVRSMLRHLSPAERRAALRGLDLLSKAATAEVAARSALRRASSAVE
ncbi:MAG TPA: MarR family winged helix-turn-helix transcriptional regulator [Gemmatimonadaceae bacterium]|nr:MarR family winged helix-turn-helix transcriptional regulator [Gemmatimonadaceae bacterium]